MPARKARRSVNMKSVVPSMQPMAKATVSGRGPLKSVLSLIMWLVGVLVSLAVGFGMTDGILKVPYIPEILTVVAGWIVVVLVLLGVLFKIIDKVS